jgi:hypothetical protein
MLVLADCSAGSAPPAQPGADTPSASSALTGSVEPTTLAAAEAAAKRALDLVQAQDWAGAWLMYTDQGKAAISQPDYVRLKTTCPQNGHIRYPVVVDNGQLVAPNRASVQATVGVRLTSHMMDYQRGHWLIEPTHDELALYAEGVDNAIAQLTANAACLG